MRDFWSFYQNIESVPHPFRVFSLAHVGYVLVTCAVIFWILKAYKKQNETGKQRWQRVLGAFLFVQEIFYYGWICVGCQTNLLFEVLHLELCTFCVFAGASVMFTRNAQVRFFAALMGLIGAPIAICYPVTVAEIYPAFSYRLIGFYLSHGALVLFALMMLSDRQLLTRKGMVNNLLIAAALLISVYFFNLGFGTQYMFVGTPPEIGIIRLVYDLVGQYAFLPVAVVIFSAYQVMMYFVAKKIQSGIYPASKESVQ